MRSFRFPRSTIFLMMVILAAVFIAIKQGVNVSMQYSGHSGTGAPWFAIPWLLAAVTVLLFVIAAVGVAILHAMRKSGLHRLVNTRPWVERR